VVEVEKVKIDTLTNKYTTAHFPDLVQVFHLKMAELNYLCVTEDDISWVLTVPAIWSDAAKQFMKEAAVKVP
jgi:molecular chaperone DnaK (HSP70)